VGLKRVLFCTILFYLFFLSVSIGKERPKRIAIVPFAIYGPKNVHYLREGICAMFAPRLRWEDKIEVIEKDIVEKAILQQKIKAVLTEDQAKKLCKKLNADYILYGRIEISNEKATIEARLLNIKDDSVKTFLKQSKKPDGLISKVHELTEEINKKVFGRHIINVKSPDPNNWPKEISRPDITINPPKGKKAYKVKSLQCWHSYPLPLETRGIDIGDIDGDGKMELTIIDEHNLWVYRFIDNRLVMIKKREVPEYLLVAVDLYDLNGDRSDEIILSCLKGDKVASMVLSWKDEKLLSIAKDIPWYIRVMRLTNGKRLIFGQRGEKKGLFRPGIFILHWKGDGFESREEICSLSNAKIYNCLFLEKRQLFMLDNENYLVLSSKDGEREWKSKRHYLKGETMGRMPLIDWDGGVVVYQNYSKNFTSEVNILNLTEMDIKWRSPRLAGIITDCQIGDIDNDGRAELVFSLIRRNMNILSNKGNTIIVAYEY